MPIEQLKKQYHNLTHFLCENFHYNALYENEDVVQVADLVDLVTEQIVMNDVTLATTIISEIHDFTTSLVYERYKTVYIKEVVTTDFGGLEPMEFILHLYFRLKMAIREIEVLLEEEVIG